MAFKDKEVYYGLCADTLWSWFVVSVATMWMVQLGIFLLAYALRQKYNSEHDFSVDIHKWNPQITEDAIQAVNNHHQVFSKC